MTFAHHKFPNLTFERDCPLNLSLCMKESDEAEAERL